MPPDPLGRLRMRRALKMPSAFYLAPPPQSQKCCALHLVRTHLRMYIIRKDNLRGNTSRKQAVNFSKVLLSPSHWLGKLFTSPQLSTVFSDSRWRPDQPMGDPLAPPKSAYTAARPLFFRPAPKPLKRPWERGWPKASAARGDC